MYTRNRNLQSIKASKIATAITYHSMCMRSMDVWAIKYGWKEWKKFWTHFGIYSLLIGAKKTHRFHGIIIYLGNIFRAHKFSFFSFVCEWVKCVLLGSREIIWQNQCLLFGGLSMMWWKYVKSRKSTLDLWHILLLLFGSMSASVSISSFKFNEYE